jgi:ABC-type transporter Mla subunit MlaD
MRAFHLHWMAALLLSAATGCGAKIAVLDAGKLNALVVESNQTLQEKGRAFGAAVGKVLQGDRAAVREARLAFESWQQALEAARTAVRENVRPEGPNADEFRAAYLAFLDSQEQALAQLAEVVQLVEDATKPLADKQERIVKLIRQAAAAEFEPRATLHHAQEAFAAAYRLRPRERTGMQ